jgi:hypothetical protein
MAEVISTPERTVLGAPQDWVLAVIGAPDALVTGLGGAFQQL